MTLGLPSMIIHDPHGEIPIDFTLWILDFNLDIMALALPDPHDRAPRTPGPWIFWSALPATADISLPLPPFATPAAQHIAAEPPGSCARGTPRRTWDPQQIELEPMSWRSSPRSLGVHKKVICCCLWWCSIYSTNTYWIKTTHPRVGMICLKVSTHSTHSKNMTLMGDHDPISMVLN